MTQRRYRIGRRPRKRSAGRHAFDLWFWNAVSVLTLTAYAAPSLPSSLTPAGFGPGLLATINAGLTVYAIRYRSWGLWGAPIAVAINLYALAALL